MNQLDERQMHEHVTIVAWLTIASGAIGLLLGLGGCLLLVGIGTIPAVQGDPTALGVLSIIGVFALLFFGFLALPSLLAGYGLLKRQKWGQILGILVGLLSLPSFPIGTAFGIYSLWVLLQQAASDYFAAREPA